MRRKGRPTKKKHAWNLFLVVGFHSHKMSDKTWFVILYEREKKEDNDRKW